MSSTDQKFKQLPTESKQIGLDYLRNKTEDHSPETTQRSQQSWESSVTGVALSKEI